MDVKFDYEQGITEINHMLKKIPEELENQERQILNKIGLIVKTKIRKYLNDSDIEKRAKNIQPSNYDGSRPYVHMKDDIISNVKRNKNGLLYVSIRGGKMTGYKWKHLNDGHFARDGHTWVPGNQFIDKTMRDVQGEIENVVDDMLKKVTG